MQIFYTVRPGDTLFLIAGRWKLPMENIIAANNLTVPFVIYPGQQLSIPSGADLTRVQPGDTVYSISQAYGVPMSVIIEANGLTPPYFVFEGQLLKIPPGVPFYIVQTGDTLSRIAEKYNVVTGEQKRVDLIRYANNLTSDTIFPGMKLKIPYAPPGGKGKIAYTAYRDGNYDIRLYNPVSGESSTLVKGLAGRDTKPYWSRDARRIAFVGKGSIIFVVDVASGRVAKIDQADPNTYLSWSPDSERLVYAYNNRIVVYNIVTYRFQIISQPGVYDAQWFPDGSKLLFTAFDKNGVMQAYSRRLDGSGKQQVTKNSAGSLNYVQLSFDGSYILYTTPGVSLSMVQTMNLASEEINEFRGGPLGKNYNPQWSPNSLWIAYSATDFAKNVYYSQVHIADRTGRNDRIFAVSDLYTTPVSWSPEGNKIAYISSAKDEVPEGDIWIVDTRRPAPVRVTEGERVAALQWSAV